MALILSRPPAASRAAKNGYNRSMKRALWGLLLLCSAAFAQNAPDNAAADALKKRMDQLKLVNPLNPVNPPQPAVMVPPVVIQSAQPKICSTPLLNALPAGSGRNVAIRPVNPLPAQPEKTPTVDPTLPGRSGDNIVVIPNPEPAEVEKMPVIRPSFPGQPKDFAVLPAPPCER
jgi:hypothetical protein